LKVLLDENMPHTLRRYLDQHETITAAYMGWAGLKNGKLLDAAESAGFQVLVTGDKTLRHEQNLQDGKSPWYLSAVHWPLIEPHIARSWQLSTVHRRDRLRGSSAEPLSDDERSRETQISKFVRLTAGLQAYVAIPGALLMHDHPKGYQYVSNCPVPGSLFLSAIPPTLLPTVH
jgi:hypothetical protein